MARGALEVDGMSGGSGRGGRGIDPKVREAALEAARRHGIPVGDWLSDGLVTTTPAATAPDPGASDLMAPAQNRRITEALERLTSRIETVEQRNSLAVVSLDRTVLGLASRLDDTEMGAREEALRMLAALGDVKGSQEALSIRLDRAEHTLVEAQSPAALKALDKQLGKLAQQVHDIDNRTDADTATLRQTIAAAQADAEARARDLATRFTEVTKTVARANDLEGRLSAAVDETKRDLTATRSAVDQTASSLKGHLASMESRLAEMNNRADTALSQLGAQVNGLNSRFGEVERSLQAAHTVQNARIDDLQAVLARDTETLKTEVASRLSAVAAETAGQLAQARHDLSAEIASAIDSVRGDDVEAALADVNRRIAAAERRQAQTIEAVSIEIKRITEAVDKRIRSVEAQPLGVAGAVAPESAIAEMAASEARTRDELAKLTQTFAARHDAADAQGAAAIEQIGEQISGLADSLNARQDKLAVDLVDQVRQVDQRAHDRLADMMSAVGARLSEVAERSDAAFAPVQAAMIEISGRLQVLEERSFAPQERPANDVRSFAAEPPAPITFAEPPPAYRPTPEPAAPQIATPDYPAQRFDDAEDLADIGAAGDDADALLDLTPAEDAGNENFWDLDADEPAATAEPEPTRAKSAKPDYIESARRAAQAATTPAAAAPPKAEKTKPEKPTKTDAAGKGMAAGLRGTKPGVIVAIGAVGIAAAAGVAIFGMPRDAKDTPDWARPQVGADAKAPSASAGATAPTPPTPPKVETLDEAAARGEPAAIYELGLTKLVAGDAASGLASLRRAADQDLAVAQYRLAKMYERGEGVEKDLRQSWQWTEKAAKGGNRKAMYDLGVFYARGEGAPFNETEAFKWFRQAAEHGVLDGQFNLGVLYQQGRGVKANPQEALFWFMVAGNGGDADARARAASLESRVAPKDMQAVTARAAAFQPKPFDQRANGAFADRTWPVPPGIDTAAP
jgi:localization factor PodJL